MKKMAWVVAMMILFGVYGCATTGTGIKTSTKFPLPSDKKVVLPDPNIGNIAKCSGIWAGEWKMGGATSFIPIVIIVEKITNEEVIAVYSQTQGSIVGVKEGWSRLRGKVSGDSIIFILLKLGKPAGVLTLTLIDDGRMISAELKSAGEVLRAIRRKISVP